jgi:hypothetical protein
MLLELVLLIWIRSDPKLFAGFGVGSGKNHSGSGQPMKMKQNFSDKIHNTSAKCTILKNF